jgi:hypothetical protein
VAFGERRNQPHRVPPQQAAPTFKRSPITLNASGSKTALRNALLATAPGGHCENMAFFFRDASCHC